METDKEKPNSIDLYYRLKQKRNTGVQTNYRKDVLDLADTMKDELCEAGSSVLLDSAVYSVIYKDPRFRYGTQQFGSFHLNLNRDLPIISHSDASLLIRCLANSVSKGQIRKNEIYDAWYENFGMNGIDPSMSTDRAVYLLQVSDSYLSELIQLSAIRKDGANSEKGTEDPDNISIVENNETDESSNPVSDETNTAESIIAKAEEKAGMIIAAAKEKANEITAESEALYEKRKREADQAVKEAKIAENKAAYEENRIEVTSAFRDIRKLLNETGIRLNQLDQKMSTDQIRTVFRQYSGLYHLINDVVNSMDLKSEEEFAALRQVYNNHLVYLDVIEENLSEFGIEPVISSAGDPFDGKIHQVEGEQNYDPRDSHVKRSLRHGFIYGNTVLEKELIELERGN